MEKGKLSASHLYMIWTLQETMSLFSQGMHFPLELLQLTFEEKDTSSNFGRTHRSNLRSSVQFGDGKTFAKEKKSPLKMPDFYTSKCPQERESVEDIRRFLDSLTTSWSTSPGSEPKLVSSQTSHGSKPSIEFLEKNSTTLEQLFNAERPLVSLTFDCPLSMGPRVVKQIT